MVTTSTKSRAKKAASNGAVKRVPKKQRVNTRQEYIPGTEPPRVKAIDNLAGEYKAIRDERMALTEQEVALKGKLRDAMEKAGLTSYVVPDSDMQVDLEPGEMEVKVHKRKAAKKLDV